MTLEWKTLDNPLFQIRQSSDIERTRVSEQNKAENERSDPDASKTISIKGVIARQTVNKNAIKRSLARS